MTRELTPERAVEVGIGLAPTSPRCRLCQRSGLACPEHAAAHVMRQLQAEGYEIREVEE